jgi:cell division protein ZapA
VRPVKVEILGNEYLLRSKAGEGHVRRVAAHLNARINEILQDSKATSNLAATVLAALNITNDLLLIKDQQEEMLQEIEAKSKRMLDKLEHGEP